MDTDDVKQMARRAGENDALEKAARVGYVVNGLMHLLIGWIALQIAWGFSGDSADQSGALSHLSNNGLGRTVLWIAVVGFLGLAVWQLTEAIGGPPKASERVKAVSKALLYAALAWTALTFARGGSSSSKSQTSDFTASLMSKPFGQALVALVGVIVLGVAVYHVRKGWKKKFLSDLDTKPGPFFVRSGQIGYVAKGVALAVVAFFFFYAAATDNPKEATGLDGALRSLVDQPFGKPLLTFIAIGFVAYGVYSFARARHGDVGRGTSPVRAGRAHA
jgi:type IV secretory pathway VirB2 component (pilin)